VAAARRDNATVLTSARQIHAKAGGSLRAGVSFGSRHEPERAMGDRSDDLPDEGGVRAGRRGRRLVPVCAAALFALWVAVHFEALTGTQDGAIRFFLALLFSTFILFLRKHSDRARRVPLWIVPLTGTAGAVTALAGLVFGVPQVEWLGLLLILHACLLWGLPARYAPNALLALSLLYWAHPLPGQAFGFLQMAMQRMSVHGAERLLHVFNVPVWADGYVLRAGAHTYEIPAWCSGMRTATTVFLVSAGLAVLRRLNVYEGAGLVVAALVQALVLNILRIAVMVVLVPRAGAALTGAEFLHQSTGAIVVAGALLVYAELALYGRLRDRRAALRNELNPSAHKVLTEQPLVLRVLADRRWAIAGALAAACLAGALIWKNRPAHRIEMFRRVATDLRDTRDLENAQRLASLVRQATPHDGAWVLTTIRILVIRGKYEEALRELDLLPDTGGAQTVQKQVLRAYSLTGLNRMQEANEIVNGLPEDVRRRDPRVAMVLAEMGHFARDPAEVARNVVTASQWSPNTARVRTLYPFLRKHRQWRAIVDSDAGVPFTESAQALSAVEAYMNLNRVTAVADMALRGMDAWPEEPRLLEPLFFLAMRRGQREWEDRFAGQLARSAKAIRDFDLLNDQFDKCFALGRPDLAWLVFHRIQALDADHPYLSLAVARHGAEWFVFRKRHLGLPAPQAADRIDLKPFLRIGQYLPSWLPVVESVPRGIELAALDADPVRKTHLAAAVRQFAQRDAQHRLPLPMHYEFVAALETAGDIPEARHQLEVIGQRHPGTARRNRDVLSAIYERKADWQNVYETLRGCLEDEEPDIDPVLRLCEAELHLDLGLAAMHSAARAVDLFPESSRAARALAASLMKFRRVEDALFVLSRPRPRRSRDADALEAEALFETQRYREMQAFCRRALVSEVSLRPDARQSLFLPPAELSALWHRAFAPTEGEMAATAVKICQNLVRVTSSFLRGVMTRWLACYEAGCQGPAADPETWEKCGRDRVEKAVALNQLCLLLCARQQFVVARNAAGMAVKFLPESPMLWQILISLCGGDLDVVEAARRACPRDAELWLAELVLRTQPARAADAPPAGGGPGSGRDAANPPRPPAGGQVAGKPSDWVRDHIDKGLAGGFLTAGVLTRAGEYLFRGKNREHAIPLAMEAVRHGRGLLPAYVLAIKCAVTATNRAWAVECTRGAIGAALKPPPVLHEKMVALKADERAVETDADMVEALKSLRAADPENPLWAQMLGFVRFHRGGWEVIDALYQMNAALDGGATNRTPYVVGAEAARLLGDIPKAVELLRRGVSQHPEDLSMVNNLAYTLCSDPKTAPEAEPLLDRLVRHSADDPRIQDTAALVCLRLGRTEDAERWAERLGAQTTPGSRLWFRSRLYVAETALGRGDALKAQDVLRDALRATRALDDEDALDMNVLRARIDERIVGFQPNTRRTPVVTP
jgi:exosortase/archaeosortase family protein